MKKKIVYEHPLTETARSYLRLEYLFGAVKYHLKAPTAWDSRSVLLNILDIIELLGRVDFKSELVDDLTMQVQTLERWRATPNVDTERLTELLTGVKEVLNRLQSIDMAVAITHFSQHYLFSLIKQRKGIIGGTSSSDLSLLHQWLHKNPKQRQYEINEWLQPIEPLREALEATLYLVRQNALVSQQTATEGFYQSKLEANGNYQLIQINMPPEQVYYPEISGGKQRFTVRFYEQENLANRPTQTEQDIQFELSCCMI
ncbi:cell division protein ZapD [Candidatus Albibeggiatoa sp. nov. NOAA]|uniref:cell division protein ZapD n=1 Tax=Candidatus Albibeggiatoa sp. nov. NOAA TaxID=3162724 RepID=UPI0033014B70|nr:cell division protein ZapD [Thiotrichaceae bacterium]